MTLDCTNGTVFRAGIPPEARGYPPFGYQRSVIDGMIFEKDVAIPLRDGVEIYGDLWRPDGEEGPLPTLIAWSPYGKHGFIGPDFFPGNDIDPTTISRHFHHEAPDPAFWCHQGYAILFVDPRGSWGSQGDVVTFFTKAEALDLYDTIEWAAVQPWSNGKIGLSGQSYFAIVQWMVAGLRPPHLACIAVWGGLSDFYRDSSRHGGIPESIFIGGFVELGGISRGIVEDLGASVNANPFAGADYWRNKEPDIEAIEVPAYVVADWTDQDMHSRGNIEGYTRLQGPKWLEINGRKKWERYFQPEYRDRLLAFYDCFLNDKTDAIADWPSVRIEVREAYKQGELRSEPVWPLERTIHQALYLDLAAKSLAATAPSAPARVEQDASLGRLEIEHRFDVDTEITGYTKLRLWVESDGADDMDLFIGLQKLDRDGKPVPFPHGTIFDDGLAALGWLRVSNRELDPDRSTPQRPWLRHQRELRLSPGEIVPVDIEIRPSSTLFRAGETLRLVIGGKDLVDRPIQPGTMGHHDLRNKGQHRFHAGGHYDSHLLLPIVP